MSERLLKLLWTLPALALLLPPASWLAYLRSSGVAEPRVVDALAGAYSYTFMGAPALGLITLLALAALRRRGVAGWGTPHPRRALWLAALAVVSPPVFLLMQVITLALSGHC